MSNEIDKTLEAALAHLLGEKNIAIARQQRASGGCISRATRIELVDGRRFFAKSSSDTSELFRAEMAGLQHLAKHSPLRTPQIVGLFTTSSHPLGNSAILVLEDIPRGQPTPTSWRELGSLLAKQHRSSESAFGFSSDNFIGATAQTNSWCSQWPEFFRTYRLEFQLQLARRNGASAQLLRLGENLCGMLDSILQIDEPPALLHGDLWNGNVIFGVDRKPVIIDPAPYYGHREAELALPDLFGGFPQHFWDAYQATWPLPSGWQQRLEIYKLYHLLNHLNLFGSGYADQCHRSLRRILRS